MASSGHRVARDRTSHARFAPSDNSSRVRFVEVVSDSDDAVVLDTDDDDEDDVVTISDGEATGGVTETQRRVRNFLDVSRRQSQSRRTGANQTIDISRNASPPHAVSSAINTATSQETTSLASAGPNFSSVSFASTSAPTTQFSSSTSQPTQTSTLTQTSTSTSTPAPSPSYTPIPTSLSLTSSTLPSTPTSTQTSSSTSNPSLSSVSSSPLYRSTLSSSARSDLQSELSTFISRTTSRSVTGGILNSLSPSSTSISVTTTSSSNSTSVATFGATSTGDASMFPFRNPSIPTDRSYDARLSSTGPSTVGPSTVGPYTVGPSTVGPSTIGPSSAGPSTAWPSTAGPSTAGPSTAGPSTARPSTFGQSTPGASTSGSSTGESSRAGTSSSSIPSVEALDEAADALASTLFSSLNVPESTNGKRKRDEGEVGKGAEKVFIKSPQRDDSDDNGEGESCMICFEDWSNTGEHRVASLKCGHLFGHSCITKWLGATGKKCPQCNAEAKKKDIRVLFCKRLKAIDTAERDRALADLEEERKRRKTVERLVLDLRVKLEVETGNNTRLKKELDAARLQLHEAMRRAGGGTLSSEYSTASASSTASSPFKGAFSITLSETVGMGARIIDYCHMQESFVISRQSENPLFPGFGVQIIKKDFSQRKYIPLHSKPIKDMAINQKTNQLLTVSPDKQIKIISLVTLNPVASYSTTRGIWSCAWDCDNDHVFYVGMDNGQVNVYDTRLPARNATDNHANHIAYEAFKSPVVALQHIPKKKSNASDFDRHGVLVGCLSGKCVFFEEGTICEEEITVKRHRGEISEHELEGSPRILHWKPYPLALEGNLTSLKVNPDTSEFLATFRPGMKHASVRHVYGRLGISPYNSAYITTVNVREFKGGTMMRQLARSALFPRPSSSSTAARSSLILAGDDESNRVFVWDPESGVRVQSWAVSEVIDICHFPSRRDGDNNLALLGTKNISLAKLN